MCYPEADEPYDKFIESLTQFKKDLHQELVYSKGINEKYIKVHEDDTIVCIWIYYQRKTLNVLKVVVDSDMNKYQQDPVQIFGEDAATVATLEALDSVSKMRHYMGEVRDIIRQDKIIATLTYGDLSSGDTST